MITRKLKPTVVITPIEEVVHTPTYGERLHAMLDEVLAEGQPSWKRTLTAWVVGLSAAVGVGYLTGMALGSLIVGATVLGAGAFLCNVILIIGLIISMYLGNKVAVFVYMNIMDKSVDALASTAYSKVRGWFGGSAIKSVAA